MDKYKILNISKSTIFFGLIFFYIGLYVLPDVTDTARIFYVFIMLPMLFIAFFQKSQFYNNKYIWLLMLLPIYLTMSHFWAEEENIIKSSFFHIKKLVYIFFFVISVFFIVRSKQEFTKTLLQTLFFAGFVSSIISIVCFLSEQCGVVNGRLSSFSVQDINKAGAMYTLHMALSLFFVFGQFFKDRKNSILINIVLLTGFFSSGIAVFFAETHATWFMFVIILFFSLVKFWSLKRMALLFGFIFIGFSLFLYFDGYSLLMKDYSFKIRFLLAEESIASVGESWLFGLGMTHKLPLLNLPHPHNIFTDVFRFGGMFGLLILVFTVVMLMIQGMRAVTESEILRFVLAWFIGGIAIMAVYAQQPITRPGGYIWFLYWMPIVLLAAEISRVRYRNEPSKDE